MVFVSLVVHDQIIMPTKQMLENYSPLCCSWMCQRRRSHDEVLQVEAAFGSLSWQGQPLDSQDLGMETHIGAGTAFIYSSCVRS